MNSRAAGPIALRKEMDAYCVAISGREPAEIYRPQAAVQQQTVIAPEIRAPGVGRSQVLGRGDMGGIQAARAASDRG